MEAKHLTHSFGIGSSGYYCIVINVWDAIGTEFKIRNEDMEWVQRYIYIEDSLCDYYN